MFWHFFWYKGLCDTSSTESVLSQISSFFSYNTFKSSIVLCLGKRTTKRAYGPYVNSIRIRNGVSIKEEISLYFNYLVSVNAGRLYASEETCSQVIQTTLVDL